MLIASIDPGKGGAIAFINAELDQCVVHDLPIKREGKKRTLDAAKLADLLEEMDPSIVVLELVGYMKGDGGKGAFSFGETFGAIKATIAVLGFRMVLVLPQVWKRALGLIGKPKNASVPVAAKLFPSIKKLLKGPRGGEKIDRADAILIGAWWLRTHAAVR